MEKQKGIKLNKDTAWKLFEKTGDVAYYLMYKRTEE